VTDHLGQVQGLGRTEELTVAIVAAVVVLVALAGSGGRHGVGGGHRSGRAPLGSGRSFGRRSVRGYGASPGARWASPGDLPMLRIGRRSGAAGQHRLVLGRLGRATLATEARHSVLVLGPTQSGKTSGLAVPAMLEWSGPVISTSVKGDLVSLTRSWRDQLGTSWVFDPSGTAGVGPGSRWSPLAEATDWAGAQRMAAWLVDSTPAKAGLADAAFWYSAAAKQLAPMLLAAALEGSTISDVVAWNNQGDFDQPSSVLARHGEVEAEVALFACAGRDERIRSSVGTTLETVLGAYEDPTVARSADGCDIDPVRLLAGNNTLYLCGAAHEQARLQGVFSALVASMVAGAVEKAERSGRALDPPLLLVLDEVANIAPLRDLDTLASTGAALGIQLMTICQDLSQLATRYGNDRARTIANNHRAKVVLSGIADLTTLDTMSGLAGEQVLQEASVTSDLRDGRRTRTTSTVYRRLVPPDELRRIKPGHGVLIYGHLPVARLILRPWFADRGLRRRVETGPGTP
jgi:type IV secretion system protein VirD4